jgi:hypothetical protein
MLARRDSMVAMNGNGYKLLGYLVWRGGKWYLRQRLPSARKTAAVALGTLSVLVAVTLIARRAGS